MSLALFIPTNSLWSSLHTKCIYVLYEIHKQLVSILPKNGRKRNNTRSN